MRQVRAGLASIETISSKGLCTDIQGVHYVLLCVLKFEQLKTKQRKKIFFKKKIQRKTVWNKKAKE